MDKQILSTLIYTEKNALRRRIRRTVAGEPAAVFFVGKIFFEKNTNAGSVRQPAGVFPTSHYRRGSKATRGNNYQPICFSMTATLSYTLVLALVYLGRKAWSPKTQQA